MGRRALIPLIFWALLAPAWAAVPNRSLSFVAIAGSDDPVAVETARRVAKHAEARLGLNPRKIHVIERVPGREAFVELFRRGAPFQYVSQGDVVVVYLSGAREKQGGLALADGVMPYEEVARVAQHLRDGPGEGLGFFNGTVLIVMDRQGGEKVRLKTPTDTAWLDLSAPRAPAVDPSLPAPDVRDPLAIAGRGALGELGQGGKVTPGAVAWVGALERLLADADQEGSVEALRQQAQAARDGTGVSATLLTGPGYETGRFRLLIQRLRVVLHPTLLANVETVQVLEALRRELLRAVPEGLKSQVQIERIDEADPRADVSCAAVANRTTAHLECVEGRAPIFADQLDVTNPEEALAPVVRQVLRDYKALAATDWSARRRDLKPLDVVLLLDSSLSMAYHDPTRATDPTLPDAPSKREIFLVRLAATLSAHAETTGRPARLTVLLFGDRVVPLALPGGSTLTLERRLDAGQLAAWGASFRAAAVPMPYTGIRDALTEAAKALAVGSPDAARHVILLTDGRESVVTTDAERAVRDAAAAVHALGATLHVVGLTEGARLGAYLQRMRAGDDVLRRYVDLLDMTYAPPACRRHAGWDAAQARTCGAFYAGVIEQAGAYDPFLLDRIRRAERPGVPTGVFLQPDSSAAFQDELQSLLSALTGGGIYLTAGGQRGVAEAGADGRVRDRWRFDLDLPGSARVVLYNRTGLTDLRWTFTQDGQPMGAAEGVKVSQESAAVTLVTLPAPARGVWVIEREGIPQ
ncbi:MAG: VWA domain-containing protein [Myxococcales bacterium]|nr:VWA domain-containing protein [Myxococcales bacterium]